MLPTLETEFRVIEANHWLFQKATQELKLLRLLLRKERGERLTLKDRWKIQEIAKRYPDLAEEYKVVVNKSL